MQLFFLSLSLHTKNTLTWVTIETSLFFTRTRPFSRSSSSRFTHHRPRHVLRGNASEQRHDRSREGVLNRKRVERRRGVPPVWFAISRVKIRTERREKTESEHAVLVPLQRDDDRGTFYDFFAGTARGNRVFASTFCARDDRKIFVSFSQAFSLSLWDKIEARC